MFTKTHIEEVFISLQIAMSARKRVESGFHCKDPSCRAGKSLEISSLTEVSLFTITISVFHD